jgi:hypothetical protein
MSIFAMDSALWGIYTSQENAEQLRTNAPSYLAEFDLTPEEAAAIAQQDFGTLLDLGAHPFLMYKMALRLEGRFSIEFLERYLGPLRGHQLRDIVT